MSSTGLIARTIEDLRIGLAAMSAPDLRDPWWVPAPLEGSPTPLVAAMCLRPGGMEIAKEVEVAVMDAGQRLSDAGWKVEEIEDVPSIHQAADVQMQLWLGDGFAGLVDAAKRDGDHAAIAVVEAARSMALTLPCDVVSHAMVLRTTVQREWRSFFTRYPVLLLPVSGELPFPDGLDLQGEAGFQRVWNAQLPLRAPPALGLPGLAVTTNLIGSVPVGVQILASHFRDIQARTQSVVIELPFLDEFTSPSGDRIFTHHFVSARENGKASRERVMGYAVIRNGKISLINFVSVPDEPASGADAKK